MRTRSLRLVLLALLGAALLAGCGDDSGVGDEPDVEEGASSSSSSTTEADEDTGGEGDGDGVVERFCEDIQAVNDAVEEASGEAVPEPGPDEAVALLRDVADQLGEIEAPSAIEDDFELYADVSDDLASALEGIDPNDEAAANQVLTDFFRDNAEALDEGQRVATYIQEECGIRFANPIG